MPRYVDVNAESLSNLHEALGLIESVDRDAFRELDLHIYGLTTNSMVVDAAKEAIADNADLAEEDVQLSEVAVAIPLSSDIIYYLAGSGLRLQREDFAYISPDEGPRTMSFTFSHYKPTVTLKYFSKLALASSDAWLDDFLKQQGSGKPAVVKQNVRRDEEATQPGVPPAPQAPAAKPAPAAPAPQAPPAPGRTSALKIRELLDKFLD